MSDDTPKGPTSVLPFTVPVPADQAATLELIMEQIFGAEDDTHVHTIGCHVSRAEDALQEASIALVEASTLADFDYEKLLRLARNILRIRAKLRAYGE